VTDATQSSIPALMKVSLLNSEGTHTSSIALQCCTRCCGREAVSNIVLPMRYATCMPGTTTQLAQGLPWLLAHVTT
jgi:hypothetical protein